ncbi:hypothetical protein [Laspinema olomoucense]|uniref:HEPN domain-containing protein n=1 Tax=Laspinema olomoucense D3b TaxID=2953688 RepID=A0ABT2N4H6_9CYAN|nr:hypothetical protein [Laspinema sp. D3b]MCT7977575.1 hypothetical protein [Laspinema sp. D3b]
MKQHLTELTPEESLDLMRKTATQFYHAAIATNCHAFIEFTGLLNEYIKVCQEFQKNNPNHDFRKCNVHNGNAIHLQPYQIEYIHEKLTCIYQNEIFPETYSNHFSG